MFNEQVLWFVTRAAGAVSLVLLSAVVVLGLLARLRVESPGWPRFLSSQLHARLAVMTLVFLTIHIVTAVVDPYTSLGIAPVILPFGSYYRTFWLGLGTVAFELLMAVLLTSLLRRVLGARLWRRAHWLAYAAWPIGVAHGIGTGTDGTSPWLLLITAACVVTVAAVAVWRLIAAPADPLRRLRGLAMQTHGAAR
jgi:methionine sulfoxide reductase heme-binding subunit